MKNKKNQTIPVTIDFEKNTMEWVLGGKKVIRRMNFITNTGVSEVFTRADIPGAPSTFENSKNCKCHNG